MNAAKLWIFLYVYHHNNIAVWYHVWILLDISCKIEKCRAQNTLESTGEICADNSFDHLHLLGMFYSFGFLCFPYISNLRQPGKYDLYFWFHQDTNCIVPIWLFPLVYLISCLISYRQLMNSSKDALMIWLIHMTGEFS